MFDDSPEALAEAFRLPDDYVPRPRRRVPVDADWAVPGVPRPSIAPEAERAGSERVVSGPVARLLEAVAGVLEQVPAELPGPVALADTAALLRVTEQLRAGC